MKSKHLLMALVGFIIVMFVIFSLKSGEPHFFEEVSRFARLGPEGEVSKVEIQQILQESTSGPIVITALQNDTSAPLESIPVIPPKKARPDPDLNELHPLPNRGGRVSPPGKFKDPVVQESLGSTTGSSLSAPLQNFDGLTNVNGVLPPDTNGDVGINHYMQWINVSFAIYNKAGQLLYGPAAGNTLWSGFGGPCQTTNDGDPIVQYDHLADRWMVSQFSLPNYPSGPFYQCIAVSQTGDPTGAWYRYAFQISASKMNDYPHFGVWPDGYYMSVNQFVGNSWAGAGVVAFERLKMLSGQPAQAVYFDLYSVDPNLGGMLPSDLDGPAPAAGTPNYFLEVDDDGFGYPQDQLEIWQFKVNWASPASSTFTRTALLPTAAFDSNMCSGNRSCIPQPGTTVKLDAIADRLMYRLQYRNFGDHQAMVLNHTVDVNNTDRAGIRWYELRNTGSGWNIFQQGTFSPDATNRWIGSAAMDGMGNLALGYSAASGSVYPSLRYTGRLVNDPLGQLPQGEGILATGAGAQTNSASRWGDYSSLSMDPVDNCTFWYTNEYVQTTGSSPWRTRIGSFQLMGCGGSNPMPTNTSLAPTATPTRTPTPTPTADVPGALTFSVAADTRVSQASPTTNYGTATTILVDGDASAAQTGLIRFTTSGISGSVQSAKLRVYCVTNGTANGPAVYLADSNWTESGTGGVTWNTQPALLSGALDNKGAIAADSWVEYDVSGLVSGNGTYTFALIADSADGITFSSREGTAPARLIVITGTAAASPTATSTAGSPTKTPTRTPTATGIAASPTGTTTLASGSVNTGFLIASANAPQSGGDGNGYQTNAVNAYLDDGLFAVDTNSGTGTTTSCTGSTKDKHRYYNFGINIPGTTILGIEVRLDAKADSTSGSPKLCIQLSWNGGSSWTSPKSTATLTTAEKSYMLGGPTDTWGHAWTLSNLSNTNFRVRISDVAGSTSRDFSLDWITVRITYR